MSRIPGHGLPSTNTRASVGRTCDIWREFDRCPILQNNRYDLLKSLGDDLDQTELRVHLAARIRLSMHRETDRHAMMSGKAEKLKVPFLNCYFARTALSEASRVPLHDRTFHFFKEGLFGLPPHGFLWTLCDHLTLLLQENLV